MVAWDIEFKDGWRHGHSEDCLSPCGVMMFFPRHQSSFDGGVHKTDGRQLTWRGLLRGPVNEGGRMLQGQDTRRVLEEAPTVCGYLGGHSVEIFHLVTP